MFPDENSLKLFIAGSAIISALVSAIIGGFINYHFNRSLKSREVQLKLIEKLIDKRLKAYEDILGVVKFFKITSDINHIDENNTFVTYPSSMHSRDIFDGVRVKFADVLSNNALWLNTDLIKELNFIQDYLCNLDYLMADKDDTYFPVVGLLVKEDFLSFHSNIEKIAYKFINQDIMNLKPEAIRGYHKYPSQISDGRLAQTRMQEHLEEIQALGLHSSQQ